MLTCNCLSLSTHFFTKNIPCHTTHHTATAFPQTKWRRKGATTTTTMTMKLQLNLLICTVQLLTYAVPSLLASPAYPSSTTAPIYSCSEKKLSSPPPSSSLRKKEVFGNGKIIDISHQIRPDLPAFNSSAIVGELVSLQASMKNGSFANVSKLKIIVHTGTHLDAPSHFYDEYYDAGFDVDSLDLEVLNGPALLVDVPRDKNITAEVMESLYIPRGVRRVLFRTRNTDRGLMWSKKFDSSYTGFTEDGAKWLVENTDIKLVGIDYLSVATFDDLISAHLVLLKSREIIIVEGLKLEDINLGLYSVHCLPLRLVGSDGSPKLENIDLGFYSVHLQPRDNRQDAFSSNYDLFCKLYTQLICYYCS